MARWKCKHCGCENFSEHYMNGYRKYGEYDEEGEPIDETISLFMKKNIISNNTNREDIVIQDSSKGKTIINGKVYEGHNIKISNNQVFIDNKLVDEVLQDESNIKKTYSNM